MAPCPDPALANWTIMSIPPPYKGRYLLHYAAIYTCDDGFNITGSPVSLCMADQTWKQAPATCIVTIPFFVQIVICHIFYSKLYSFTFV